MWQLYLVMLPFAIGIALYFKGFFKRSAKAFGLDISKKWVKVTVWTLGIFIGILCVNVFSTETVTVLHILALDALFRLVDFLIRLIFKDRYKEGFKIWKKLYGSGLLSVLIIGVMFTWGYFNIHNVVRTDYTVYTDKNVGDGYRIVLIADIHYGVTLDEEELAEKCEEISGIGADLVVLCGDMVDNDTTKQGMRTLFNVLGDIESKYGTYYVYGNHDRLFGDSGAFTPKELEETITANGIIILQDETMDIDGMLTLAGREDKGYTGEQNRKSITELLENTDKDRFILTLDHQPTDYKENGKAGTDLLLSGHTHGGQFWPLNIVFELFNINEGVYGKINIDSDTEAIVTSGFAGWSFPVKTAAPAEYVVINIKNERYNENIKGE